jgi:hypothetical protein
MTVGFRERARLGRLSLQQCQVFGFRIDLEGRIIGDIDLPVRNGKRKRRSRY